uniref:Uncharacterized protein n=1 Tax=Fagus sylvatica TaxID=28930 RepID=A0A2N9IFD6_FAGSY
MVIWMKLEKFLRRVTRNGKLWTRLMHGKTLLHLAISQGRAELVQLLLEFEPDVKAQTRSGSSPLEAAAASGEALIVELLLARRAIQSGPSRQLGDQFISRLVGVTWRC